MAVRTAGSFVASTAVGYTIRTTPTSTALVGATDSLASEAIATNTNLLLGKKVVMGMEVIQAFSNVAATLTLEVSHNGTEFAEYATLTADTTPDVQESKIFVVDLQAIEVPYMRLHFNKGALSVGTAGTAKFFYAHKTAS